MSCVPVLGAFHVNTASTASGSGLTPCLSTIFPRYLIESLRISHFNGLHFKPALFMHPKTSSGCCYEYVIHVTHHEIPVLLCHSGLSLSHQSLKGGRCVAQAEGHPPLIRPQFTRESGLFSILLPQRDLPEGRTQVQCGEELGITKFEEALVYSPYRIRIFYRYRVQVTKVATKSKLPPFFFAITTPQAHGNFEGSIMSYSSNISISARHASDLCGVIRLAPSLWGMAPSSSSIWCSKKLQQPISALCFESTSAFRFRRSRNFSKSPSPIFLFKCSISGKTVLSDSSSYDEGRSGKFEQLDKPSSISDFIENNL